MKTVSAKPSTPTKPYATIKPKLRTTSRQNVVHTTNNTPAHFRRSQRNRDNASLEIEEITLFRIAPGVWAFYKSKIFVSLEIGRGGAFP